MKDLATFSAKVEKSAVVEETKQEYFSEEEQFELILVAKVIPTSFLKIEERRTLIETGEWRKRNGKRIGR